MQDLYIAVCEGNLNDRNRLLRCIDSSRLPVRTEIFPAASNLLDSFSAGRYHLVFMEICPNETDHDVDTIAGIEAAAQIRRLDSSVYIVFTTSATEYAMQAYRLRVQYYLEKPVEASDVAFILQEVRQLASISRPQALSLGVRQIPVPLDSILYLEQDNHTLTVVQNNGNRLSATATLKSILPQLEGSSLVRCHNSFVVNFRFVRTLNQQLMVFEMENDDFVQISRDRFRKTLRKYNTYAAEHQNGQDTDPPGTHGF